MNLSYQSHVVPNTWIKFDVDSDFSFNLACDSGAPFVDSCISALQVFNALDKYAPDKACGSDLIPTFLYKTIAPFICEPLAHIYNLSLATGCFPSVWKNAHVIGVPKCKEPTIIDIYPISFFLLL